MNPSINVNWTPGLTLEEMEKQVILTALKFYQGNKTQTSIALGVSVRTIDTKLEKYESDRLKFEETEKQRRIDQSATLARLRGGQPYTDASKPGQGVLGANSGMLVEPAADAAAEHAVPMPQRQEVQSVLPRHAPQSSNHKRR